MPCVLILRMASVNCLSSLGVRSRISFLIDLTLHDAGRFVAVVVELVDVDEVGDVPVMVDVGAVRETDALVELLLLAN
ncbi:hypothetical protein O9G_003529 [Rozella allomycis CSF55]|uniref:Uncharacterized protein n=1 Tax=Rozella allomycis (strain CSF55) TaxID=988480 RepID=A0A075B455_ROZAC|nr:hypothetical protein O9G_003529 [Rozella allomycis CSF55]|eukprot:EPZ35884.1 hypothetical protein O9G_003529 [Rozella allomycis CSF55]